MLIYFIITNQRLRKYIFYIIKISIISQWYRMNQLLGLEL